MIIFRRGIFLTLLLILPFSQPTLADNLELKPYRASYKAEYNFLLPFTGTAVRELKKTSNQAWLLSNNVESSLITIKEGSRFNWVDGQPQQITYRFDQKGLKKKQIWLDFDWQQLLATNISQKEYPPYKINNKVFDLLTYQTALRLDLLNQSNALNYQVAEKKRIKNYRFEILGEEILETPMGQLKTVKILRKRKPDSTRESVFWLAKDWDYLLVKIRQKERGNTYFIVMQEGELDGQPITGPKPPPKESPKKT